MSRHRFFIASSQVNGQQVFLAGEQARQIYQVLRLRPGHTIEVFDNGGWEYAVVLETVTADRVSGAVRAKTPVAAEPAIQVTLYQSTLKKDNFEWILQKGTELGITSFVPVVSQRSIVRADALKRNKIARWQRILVEAAEQSGRGCIPTLHEVLALEEALAAGGTSDMALMPWEEETALGLLPALRAGQWGSTAVPLRIALFIGPEGGYTAAEIDLARAAGVLPVTLGPRILRSETAAVVAAALVLGELGELG